MSDSPQMIKRRVEVGAQAIYLDVLTQTGSFPITMETADYYLGDGWWHRVATYKRREYMRESELVLVAAAKVKP